MAHVRKLANGTYQCRYIDPVTRKERAENFARKLDADNRRKAVDGAVLTGTYVDTKAGRVTFREYAESWRTGRRNHGMTAAATERNLRLHVYPVLGDLPLSRIVKSDIAGRLQVRLDEDGLSAESTAKIVTRLVLSILTAAVDDRVILSHPAPNISTVIASTKIVAMTVEQVHAIEAALAEVDERHAALAYLGFRSGLRIGELCALSIDNFNALGRTVTVERTLGRAGPKGAGHCLTTPKTAAGRRTVPIGQDVVDVLAAHIARYGTVEFDGVELIFSNRLGHFVQSSRFARKIWGKARALADVGDEWTPHDMRHFYASALIRHGIDLKTLQSNLGHSPGSPVTLRTYGHLWGDHDDRTRAAIAAAFVAPESDAAGTGRAAGTS